MKNLVLALLNLQLAVVFTSLFHLIQLKMFIVLPSRITSFSLQRPLISVAFVKYDVVLEEVIFKTTGLLLCRTKRFFIARDEQINTFQLPKAGRDDRTTRAACTYDGLHRISFFLFNHSLSPTLQLPVDFRATSKIYLIQLLEINRLVIWAPQAPREIIRACPFPPIYVASMVDSSFLS